MKRKLPALAALVALLACALGGAALATAGPAMESEVSIRFAETIHFDRMQGEGGMDIDYGIQPLPMPGVAMQIPNPDGSHTLRVRDGRVNAGNWSVSVKQTAYIMEGTNAVLSTLLLYDPVCSAGLTMPLISAPVASPPYLPDLQFFNFGISDKKIVDAASGLTQGSYDVTIAPGHVCINTSNPQFAKPVAYSTTILWTLTSTPTTP